MSFFRRRKRPKEEPPPPRGDLRWGPYKRDATRFSLTAPWATRETVSDDGAHLYGWGWDLFKGERSMSEHRWILATNVSGVSHRAEELQADGFAPGQHVSLVADPKNRYDPNAVEVWDADKAAMVGYVPKGDNVKISTALKDGRDLHAVVVWEWRKGGERAAIRVLISPEPPEIAEEER